MARKALIIVDAINDFFPGGALPISGGHEIVDVINGLIKRGLRENWLLAAVRCWHPAVTTHFDKWGAHGVQNTWGARFHPRLNTASLLVFNKGSEINEDGFSGFEGKEIATQMILEDVLVSEGVTENLICGLALEYCDKATAIQSAQLGFKTHLLYDACRALNMNYGDDLRAIQEMLDAGVSIDVRY